MACSSLSAIHRRLTAVRRSLRAHGLALSYFAVAMRQLRPAQKAIIRALKAKSGTEAAIRKAQELAGKRKAA